MYSIVTKDKRFNIKDVQTAEVIMYNILLACQYIYEMGIEYKSLILFMLDLFLTAMLQF